MQVNKSASGIVEDGRKILCNGKEMNLRSSKKYRRWANNNNNNCLQWTLVAIAWTIVTVSPCVSSLPTTSNDISSTFATIQQVNDPNHSFIDNDTSSVVRDFAVGVANSDSVNITDEFQDQHDSKRVDVLRERNKQQRLVLIQKTILEKLGLNQTPNISGPPHVSDDYKRRMVKVFHILQSQPTNVQTTESADIFAKRVQSFYPSCSLPRNMDRDMWADSNLFHIYYELPVPQPMEGTRMSVASAKLRLFKMAPQTDNSVTSTLSTITNSKSFMLEKNMATADLNSLSCDEKIRITVYQYTKPLKKAKKVIKRKRKLIDSKMVSVDFEGWLEFDVRSSARDWLENSSRNLGLEIELEDSMANTHNPSEFLRNMNCSEGRSNDPPFPRFMEDRIKDHISDEDTTALFENETYPTLDLKTVEIEDPVDIASRASRANNSSSKQTIIQRSLHKRHTGSQKCETSYTISEEEEYGESSSCCKRETFVSFADFEGGERIVEPLGFYTKTCVGFCNPIKGEQYVCAPKIKSGIDVIVVDDQENKVKINLPDLVTKSCSCQSKEIVQQSTPSNDY